MLHHKKKSSSLLLFFVMIPPLFEKRPGETTEENKRRRQRLKEFLSRSVAILPKKANRKDFLSSPFPSRIFWVRENYASLFFFIFPAPLFSQLGRFFGGSSLTTIYFHLFHIHKRSSKLYFFPAKNKKNRNISGAKNIYTHVYAEKYFFLPAPYNIIYL